MISTYIKVCGLLSFVATAGATDTCSSKLSAIQQVLDGVHVQGECVCDPRIVNELRETVREMQALHNTISSKYAFCWAGITTGRIPLSSITASGTHSTCPIRRILLNNPAGSWCGGTQNQYQWVQVDLEYPRRIVGVLTQGRPDCCDQWVTHYKVSYGNNSQSLQYLTESAGHLEYPANINRDDVVKNVFPEPIIARYFRIYATRYHNWPSMRLELLEC